MRAILYSGLFLSGEIKILQYRKGSTASVYYFTTVALKAGLEISHKELLKDTRESCYLANSFVQQIALLGKPFP